jgi:hypothetical protein
MKHDFISGIEIKSRMEKKYMYYNAVLHTGNKTEEQIKEEAKNDNWIGNLKEEDIERMIKYYNHFDGAKVVVADQIGGTGYTMVLWENESDNQVKEALYLMEQDEYFGSYIEERELFDTDWENGEYESGGSISFKREDVEIIGVLES